MRVLGIDLGSKRIGIAVSDVTATVASPLTMIERSRSSRHDLRRLAALAREEEAGCIVVGLPYEMSGRKGSAARSAENEARALASVVDVPVELCDERLTTVTAQRALAEGGVPGRARRQVIDKVAAAVMLQAWLDGRRSAEARRGERDQ